MTEQEKQRTIMDYLHKNVFDPILTSPNASVPLKQGVRLTIVRMNPLIAAKKRQFFWSAISGTEKSIKFAQLMEKEGFTNFEAKYREFREIFTDKWLNS